MPSLPHETLVELFRADPRVLVELGRASGKLPLPPFATLRVQPGEPTELLPASLRADALVVLEQEAAVYALVAEVQLGRDDEKLFS